MASTIFFILSLLITITFTSTANTTAQATTAHKTAQINTIINAMITAGDFSNWAKLLSTVNISTVPLSATVFIPLSVTGNHPFPTNTNLVLLPRRLSFSQLQLFPTGARLPTIIPGATLLITNNSAVNFTINGGAKVTKPDLFQNAVVCIHGVDGFLDHHGSPPPPEAALGVSVPASRRKPPSVNVHPRPPVILSKGVTTSFWNSKVVVVVFMILHGMYIVSGDCLFV
ncbi:hypothetical protein RND81_13G145100 [Saponaria officinalis]|uniref:FAS1 domain-containing protein n=1 Tax=Saponaria officinalis TaxID=3572 RepID=A0AAW1GXQ3_SAPOF